MFGGVSTLPVSAPPGSAAADEDRRGAGPAPAPAPGFLAQLTSPRVLLLLVLAAAAVFAGVSYMDAAPAAAASDAAASKKPALGKDGKPVKAPKSPSKTPKPKPTPSPTSSPDGECTCDAGANKGGKTILHFLSVDSPEGITMGNTGGPNLENSYLLWNVQDIVNKDPIYPGGRTVVLYRPRGPFNSGEGSGVGHEINQATFATLSNTGIFSENIVGQKCKGVARPAFLYIDASNDADAGDWLGESAPSLVARWASVLKAEPSASLLLKAPATHKTAMLQLLGIPQDKVVYINKGGIPCEKGNKVYVAPMGQNSLPGWSQSWWKQAHYNSLMAASRKAAGLPDCPAKPPTAESGIVLVPRTEAERLESKGKASAFEEAMATYVAEKGGKVVKMPESLSLADAGTEMKEFVEALGTARVLILPATSSTGFYAGLARSATIIIEGSKGKEGAKTMAVPGWKTELGIIKTNNLVDFLPEDKGKGEDVTAAQAKVQEVLDGKEKAKMPKCTTPKME